MVIKNLITEMRENLNLGHDMCSGVSCNKCGDAFGVVPNCGECREIVKNYITNGRAYLFDIALHNKEIDATCVCNGISCEMCENEFGDSFVRQENCSEVLLSMTREFSFKDEEPQKESDMQSDTKDSTDVCDEEGLNKKEICELVMKNYKQFGDDEEILCRGILCGECRAAFGNEIWESGEDCDKLLLERVMQEIKDKNKEEDKVDNVKQDEMKETANWYGDEDAVQLDEDICKDKSHKKVIYLAGDLCKKGNVLLREKEAEYIRQYDQLQVYSPIEDKEINDKQNQTAESNRYLCDKIYNKDMKAIRGSEYIIMDVDNDSVGTITELGAIAEFNWFHNELAEILKDRNSDLRESLKEFMEKYPKKKVYFHNSDIRNTELPEQGMFRSYSLNQFSHGAIRFLNEDGVEDSFETCVDKILKDGRPDWIECVHGLYQCPWDETVFSTNMYGEYPFSVDELCVKKD